MTGSRKWRIGYVCGWCLVNGDHDRCVQPHVAGPDLFGCHCPVCLEREANPPVAVEGALNPAEAPPAPEPGASAGTNDASPLAARVLELHAEASRIGGSRVRPTCAHCGRAYPCPTAQLALEGAS